MKSVLCVWILILIPAATPPVPSGPQSTSDPNDPERQRAIIPRGEREKLGLAAHTWTGVVQPEVYQRLDKVTKHADALRNRKDIDAFDKLWSIRFEEMVYVQVQVKDMDARRRVLASLTALDFHTQLVFKNSAGLVGFISKAGLDKLAKHTDVVSVCLDEKPLPGPDKIIVKDIVPKASAGDTAADQPGVKEGKVDVDTYRAFSLAERIDVIVSLRGESLPPLSDKPSEMIAKDQARSRAVKQLQDRILSRLSADDFWLKSRRVGSALSGQITKDGLQKLSKHPEITRVGLQSMMKTQ